ncbi:MAG: hypothetical protein Q7K29_01225 [Thermoleophilia bacterium]|nr:hypothetical protein [Thermoleophilia bacterium]
MSRRQKRHFKWVTFTILPVLLALVALVPAFFSFYDRADATDASDWTKVKNYVAAYFAYQYDAAEQGEAGYLISAASLNTRINSVNDAAILGEGDNAATAPVMVDNLGTSGTWIPGTSERCQWNVGSQGSAAPLTGYSQNCFDNQVVNRVKAKVDAHANAGFSTDLVVYCGSGKTEAPTTGAFGYIAQAGGLRWDGSKIKVLALKWGRNGWNNTTVSYTRTGAIGAATANADFVAPTTNAASTACSSIPGDIELVRCQAQQSIYTAVAIGGMTGGNVSNGQVPTGTAPAAALTVGALIDPRTGTPGNTVSAYPTYQIPIDTLFTTGLVNIPNPAPANGILVASSNPMMGGIVAEGLKMLGYTMATGGFISDGLPSWNNTLAGGWVSDGGGRPAVTAVVPDTVAPVVSGISAGTITANSAIITRTTSNEPATMKVEYGTAPGVYTSTQNSTILNAANKTVNLTGLTGSQLYYYRVTSYDGQANGTVDTEKSFTTLAPAETTPPVTSDNAPLGWQNANVTVTLTCDDGAGSGCLSTSWTATNGGGSGTGTSVVISAEGTTVISYHSTDVAGNVETPDKTATVQLDKTAPTATNVTPSGFIAGPTATIGADLSDTGGSGVDATSVMIHINGTGAGDGNMLMNCPTETASRVECIASALQMTTGPHAIHIYAMDLAGNPISGNAIASGSLTVDNVAPTTSDNAPPGWQMANTTVTLTCDDGTGSGCASTSWSATNGGGSGSGTSVVVSNEGTTVISYHSTDVVGNVETPDKTATVQIDKSAPTTSDNAPPGWQNANTTVTLTCNDGTGSGCASTSWSANNGGGSGSGTSVVISAEGVTTISYHSTDVAGNVETPDKTATVSIDKTIPVISNNLPTGTSGNTSPTISASLADSGGSGINTGSVTVSVNATPENMAGCTVSASSVSCPKSGLTDGTYNVVVDIDDNAGNPGTLSWSFTINTAAPVIDSMVPGAGTWTTDNTPTVTINYHASGTIDSATLSIDAVPCAGLTFDQTHVTCTAPTLGDGPHVVSSSIGVGANITATGGTFGVDTTPPVTSNKTPTGVIRTAATIEADITETGSGIDGPSSTVSLDSTLVAGCTWSNTHVSCPAPALSAGSHLLSYVVYDNAGWNNGFGNSLGTFDVDLTGPVFSSITPTGYVTSEAANISVYYSDAATAVDPTTLVVTWDGATIACAAVDAVYASCPQSGLPQGSHTIGVSVDDTLGNNSTGSSVVFVDSLAPTVASGYYPGNNSFIGNASPTISVTPADRQYAGYLADTMSGPNLSTVVVTLDGSTMSCTNTSGVINCPASGLAEGAHSWIWAYNDNAGNAATRTRAFTVDLTNPVVSGVTADMTTITATISDALSGINVASAIVTVDGTEVPGCVVTTTSISCSTPTGLSVGAHPIVVNVDDNVGNTGSDTGTLDISDYPSSGAIGLKRDSLGGAAGQALGPEYAINGPAGYLGQAQDFANGTIYWSPTGGCWWVHGGILVKYNELGGPTGLFGMPVSDEYDIAGGRGQNFAGCSIYWSANTGAHGVRGAIQGKLLSDGGVAVDGFPTTDEYDVAGYAGARAQDFERAQIYWTPTMGAHTVRGGIMQKYVALGGPGALGLPLTDEYNVPGVINGRESDFQNGRIYYHPLAGIHAVRGGILAKYLSAGGPAGFLGMPTTDEMDVAGVAGAREGDFQRGRIYWSPTTGSHTINGGIFNTYIGYGGPTSALGLPITDEYSLDIPGARRSRFEHGFITFVPGVGAWVDVI